LKIVYTKDRLYEDRLYEDRSILGFLALYPALALYSAPPILE